MKNVHLIPTDKGQRITKTNNGTFLFCSEVGKDFIEIRKGYSGFHLYITSSVEGIEEGDYVIEDIGGVVYGPIDRESIVENPKKIILTTDLELINDGVQPIDNEFLEWFVKNPSCEKVEVETTRKRNGYSSKHKKKYSIIIPSEEPKQSIQEFIEQHAITEQHLIDGYKQGLQLILENASKIPNQEVAKQNPTMYSEEEVEQIFNIGQMTKDYGDYKPYTFKETLEQFKK